MNKIEATLEDIRKLKKIKDIFAIVLYGSVARGDYSIRHSDIDILIILENSGIKDKVDRMINDISIKNRIKVHTEYQIKQIRSEDQTLLWKMFEEGKVIFSKGIWFLDKENLGLEAFRLYRFDTLKLDKVGRVMLSRALHGRKGFKGIIDDISVIDTGRGGLLVRKDKFKDIEEMFERFKIKYKVIKTVYG